MNAGRIESYTIRALPADAVQDRVGVWWAPSADGMAYEQITEAYWNLGPDRWSQEEPEGWTI